MKVPDCLIKFGQKLMFEKFNTEPSNYQTPCRTTILSAQCLEIIKKSRSFRGMSKLLRNVKLVQECQSYKKFPTFLECQSYMGMSK